MCAGSQLRILLHVGVLTRAAGTSFAESASRGGPLGELVQWSDLLAALHALGHELVVTTELEDLLLAMTPMLLALVRRFFTSFYISSTRTTQSSASFSPSLYSALVSLLTNASGSRQKAFSIETVFFSKCLRTLFRHSMSIRINESSEFQDVL